MGKLDQNDVLGIAAAFLQEILRREASTQCAVVAEVEGEWVITVAGNSSDTREEAIDSAIEVLQALKAQEDFIVFQ